MEAPCTECCSDYSTGSWRGSEIVLMVRLRLAFASAKQERKPQKSSTARIVLQFGGIKRIVRLYGYSESGSSPEHDHGDAHR